MKRILALALVGAIIIIAAYLCVGSPLRDAAQAQIILPPQPGASTQLQLGSLGVNTSAPATGDIQWLSADFSNTITTCLGAYAASFLGISQGPCPVTTSNYRVGWGQGTTYLNANSGGSTRLRVANADVAYAQTGSFTLASGTTLGWSSGVQELNEPRFYVTCDDAPGVLADANETLCSFGPLTRPITVQSIKEFVELAAASCTTAPVYNVVYGTTYLTVGTTIKSGLTATETARGVTDSGIAATNVAANNYIWINVATAASSCAAKNHLVIEYTMQ